MLIKNFVETMRTYSFVLNYILKRNSCRKLSFLALQSFKNSSCVTFLWFFTFEIDISENCSFFSAELEIRCFFKLITLTRNFLENDGKLECVRRVISLA